MNRIGGKAGLRAVLAGLLVFAALLFAAPQQSAASSYTINYTGTVTSTVVLGGPTDLFAALGIVAGDTVSGSLTFPSFNEVADYTPLSSNALQPASSFTFQVSHPGGGALTKVDTGLGNVVHFGPFLSNQINLHVVGANSGLTLSFSALHGPPTLSSFSGLPDTSTGLIAFLLSNAGNSPSAIGTFSFPGFGQLNFDIAFSTATTPIPAALPLFASALGGLGFATWRRRKTAARN